MPPANNQRVRVRKGRAPARPKPRRRGYIGFDSNPYDISPLIKSLKKTYHQLNPFD
jgi:hypothetical protein